MQTHCIGYPHSHITYTNALDHCVCIKYKVIHIHSVTMIRIKDAFLVYGGLENELVVNGFTDASFQSNKDDYRSHSGYVFCLNGGAGSWKSSKQVRAAQHRWSNKPPISGVDINISIVRGVQLRVFSGMTLWLTNVD
uniref:Uncharacterized protein n=1 Tax=Cucumis melo TaxID=3656 RepID=A0A9I9EEP0_CUCME